MKRIHNSKEKNLVIENKSQEDYFKPKGLWYGIDNEWIDWCKDEMPGWVHKYNYVLELDMTKILWINNSRQLKQFCEEYSVCFFNKAPSIHSIDWKKVTLKFSGIEINPYLYENRLDINGTWYYGWDCASGCIWNKDAILSYKMEDTK